MSGQQFVFRFDWKNLKIEIIMITFHTKVSTDEIFDITVKRGFEG